MRRCVRELEDDPRHRERAKETGDLRGFGSHSMSVPDLQPIDLWVLMTARSQALYSRDSQMRQGLTPLTIILPSVPKISAKQSCPCIAVLLRWNVTLCPPLKSMIASALSASPSFSSSGCRTFCPVANTRLTAQSEPGVDSSQRAMSMSWIPQSMNMPPEALE
jgi:hypothetical protein